MVCFGLKQSATTYNGLLGWEFTAATCNGTCFFGWKSAAPTYSVAFSSSELYISIHRALAEYGLSVAVFSLTCYLGIARMLPMFRLSHTHGLPESYPSVARCLPIWGIEAYACNSRVLLKCTLVPVTMGIVRFGREVIAPTRNGTCLFDKEFRLTT